MLKKACYIILLMHIQTEAGLFDKSFQELKLEAESLAKRHQTIKRVLTSIKQSNSDKITLKQHLETVSDNIDKWEQDFASFQNSIRWSTTWPETLTKQQCFELLQIIHPHYQGRLTS
ncbi:MAG: hypothetical protein CL947_00360 [Epsilonproteobacteria bacterium]|nr:hypothetical protein [Campylobacterota bacterium]|tara:strand:- start:134 stop:484 length:351 start_codon:yes stop_codon:yes gene_type:complete